MRLLTATVLALAAALAPAQVTPLEPVPKAEQKPSSTKPAEQLLEDLGSADYGTRAAATEALRKMGETARRVLEKGLTSTNVERKTRARSLLDALDEAREEQAADGDRAEGREGLRRLRPLRPNPRETLPDSLRQLERTLEEFDRVLKMPRWTFPDAFKDLRPFPDPFQDLRTRLRQDLTPGGSGESIVSIVRDGETLELRRSAKGGIDLKITSVDPRSGIESVQGYQAPDVETFREKYPEIYERYKKTGIFSESTGGFSFRFGPFGERDQEDTRDPITRWPGVLPPSPAGPSLGIIVEPVPQALRAHVAIPDQAVMVSEVVPGSLAERTGLSVFDIITHVDGKAVGRGAQIRRILARSEHPNVLRLKLFRKGKELTLEGEWPGSGVRKLKKK